MTKTRINLDSSALTLLRCPQLFKYVTLDGYKPKARDNDLVWGSAVHKGFEVFYKNKLDGKEDIAVSDAVNSAIDYFTRNGGIDTPPKTASAIVEILNSFLWTDDFKPIHVEKYWEIPLFEDENCIIYLCGKVDAIGEDSVEGLVIKDIKTTSSYSFKEIYNYYVRTHQFMIYSFFASKALGYQSPIKIMIDIISPSLIKSGAVKRMHPAIEFNIDLKESLLESLHKTAVELAWRIKNDIFQRNYSSCKSIFNKQCPFYEVCSINSQIGDEILKRNFERKEYNPANH